MNKFILEIKVTNDNYFGLEIKIIHWDNRFIFEPSDPDNYPFCYFTSKNGFTIYSNHDGEIYSSTLEIPTYNNLKNNNVIRHNFSSDYDRLDYLKDLYKCLDELTNEYEKFKDDTLKNDKIIVSDKYWIK